MIQLIKNWEDTVKKHIDSINLFLNKSNLLYKEYTERTKNKTDIGFNIFTLSSDFYYRENFHSDIIKSFLDPNEKHNEGNKYLYFFIDLLNKAKGNDVKISKDDFQNATVERERYHIDILITDENSKKAIIIENKINNAVDQQRQLPRYVKNIKKEFKIVAIVYLTLNSSKRPDKSDWNKSEIKEINQILKIIPAYEVDKSKVNLFDNWIVPSIINSDNIDSTVLLRQYGNLIKYLNTNTMDTISLEKFYNSLQENDNLKTAISIKNMLNDLPEYLAIRIEDKYKNHCYPFKNIWRYKQSDTVFEEFINDNNYFKLDVWCYENGYTTQFWCKDADYDISSEYKDKFEFFSGFSIHNNEKNSIKKHFDIFEEDKLYEFIDNLLDLLKKIKENSK